MNCNKKFGSLKPVQADDRETVPMEFMLFTNY